MKHSPDRLISQLGSYQRKMNQYQSFILTLKQLVNLLISRSTENLSAYAIKVQAQV